MPGKNDTPILMPGMNDTPILNARHEWLRPFWMLGKNDTPFVNQKVSGSKHGLDSDHILISITINWFAGVSI
jgi:hypothetical protein